MKARMPYPANMELMLLVAVVLGWSALEIFRAWAWFIGRFFD